MLHNTSRSVQRADATNLISAGNSHVADPAHIWGSPAIEDDFKFWGNFGGEFGELQLYGHTNFANWKVTGGFFFRNPNTRAGVYSADGGKTLLIGDSLDVQEGILDGSAGCPEVIIVNGVPDRPGLDNVFSDPDWFSFQEIFPGGFTPQFGGEVRDASVVAGLRGQTSIGMDWNASFNLGSNEVNFFIFVTVNASLGPATPTEFNRSVLDSVRLRQLQEALPGNRWNLTAQHETGPWRLFGRLSYYDDWYDYRDARVYSGDYLFDLQASPALSGSPSPSPSGPRTCLTINRMRISTPPPWAIGTLHTPHSATAAHSNSSTSPMTGNRRKRRQSWLFGVLSC